MRFLLFASLVLFLGAAGAASAQDIHAGRRLFQDGLKKKELKERKAGIDALVATKDLRGLDDFREAIEKHDAALEDLRKKIETTGEKLRELWKNVDKQAGAGRPVSVGSVTGVEKKTGEIQQALQKMDAEQDDLEATRRAIVAGAGKLLDSADPSARLAWIGGAIKTIDQAKKLDEQLPRLHMVQASRSPEARDALVELVTRATDPLLRTAAIDALGETQDPVAAGALGSALKDDDWNVRAAATRALARLPTAAGIGPLVESLATAEGRSLEDAILALEDLTGRTFHDNATLWAEWWKKESGGLETSCKELASDDPGAQRRSAAIVADQGFLVGVHLILKATGLDPRRTEDDATDAAPKAKLDAAFESELLAATSRALAKVPGKIRDRAVRRFVLLPFQRDGDVARRVQRVLLLRGVESDTVRALLTALSGEGSLRDPRTGDAYKADDRGKLRRAAVDALAGQSHAEAAQALRKQLESSDKALRLAAVASLRKIKDKAAIDALIAGLGLGDEDLKKACKEALVELVGADRGDTYEAWRNWWMTARETFKLGGAAVASGNPNDPPVPARGGTSFYGIETRSLHILYILDRSGSMNENDAKQGGTRMDAARTELVNSIRSLPDNATFNIIFYNHEYDTWKKSMTQATKENKTAAIDWVKSVDAVGATNIFDPIERGFDLAGRGTHDKAYGVLLDTVFLMTDGQPNRGRIIVPIQILKEISRMNALKKVKIHTIGVGDGQDEEFLRRIAEMTGGSYVRR